MTTGRINQVTILSPDAAREGWAPEIPPEGRSCYERRGTHEVDPAKRGGKRGRDLPPGGYSIAPTEFPKVRSAVEQSGHKDRPCYTAYAPQVEGCNHQVSTRRRILARAVPPEAWFG